jgi:hypothetical protein
MPLRASYHAFFEQLHPRFADTRVELSTRTTGEVDTGDQFIDTASQSLAQRQRALQVELILQVNPLTRRLNLRCNVNSRLNPNELFPLHQRQ